MSNLERKYTQNDLDIALLQREMEGLRQQHKAHALKSDENFETVFEKLETMGHDLSRGKGIFAGALIVSGAIGASIVKAIGYVMSR